MAAFERDFQAWRKSRADSLLDDFGELCRFREANAALKPAGSGESRVVFFGDSITEGWNLEQYFPGKAYINRGICAQTTPQMLVRFRPDVIALGAGVAVILAGTNDIGGNTGPMSLEEIAANLASMADIAKAHRVRAVFSSLLPPAHQDTPGSRFNLLKHPLDQVLGLNTWLRGYCAASGLEFIDYFSAMSGPDGLVRPELSEDGLHPTALGYQIMAPLAEAAIRHALRRELPNRTPAPNPGS
jgi:lysophospholipase L1-like esterase